MQRARGSEPVVERSQLVVTSHAMSSIGASDGGGDELPATTATRARCDLKRGVTWQRIARGVENRRATAADWFALGPLPP